MLIYNLKKYILVYSMELTTHLTLTFLFIILHKVYNVKKKTLKKIKINFKLSYLEQAVW